MNGVHDYDSYVQYLPQQRVNGILVCPSLSQASLYYSNKVN